MAAMTFEQWFSSKYGAKFPSGLDIIAPGIRKQFENEYQSYVSDFNQEAYNSAAHVNSQPDGLFTVTGDPAQSAQVYDQMMQNTSYQRAASDMQAAGLNPMFMFTHGASGAGQASAAAVGSQGDAADRKIAQQNANSQSKQADAALLNAQANMKSAKANTAKAVSSFLPQIKVFA